MLIGALSTKANAWSSGTDSSYCIGNVVTGKSIAPQFMHLLETSASTEIIIFCKKYIFLYTLRHFEFRITFCLKLSGNIVFVFTSGTQWKLTAMCLISV